MSGCYVRWIQNNFCREDVSVQLCGDLEFSMQILGGYVWAAEDKLNPVGELRKWKLENPSRLGKHKHFWTNVSGSTQGIAE